ncbi:MAG TPA: hypothetical protein VK707_10020 [Solirubrobacteraceae bacterium]|jgi:hypothetical protein|nr:hypothetical protein [Solirubrobacteraceae bacterium]
MRRARAILACAALAPLWGAVAPARGDVFGPIGLASVGAAPGSSFVQQADFANDSALSGDGRYVAFDGSFAGHRGVFRRDLLTGEVATVAEGDAMLPSISADGRYVSFTTTARLDPADDANEAPDVYVRDMDNPNTAPCQAGEGAPPCAYALASAVDGSTVGLSYEYGANRAFEQAHYGSVASGRSALSANGREVAFETTAISNLANPNRGAAGGVEEPKTPAAQVAVRDLETNTTTLVSARYDPSTRGPQLNVAGQPEPTPASAEGGFGAVYPSGSEIPPFPSAYAGASLSADGSTVAWMGQQISQQAPVMSGGDLADAPSYTEPLWRRIGEGQGAPTRRVTGGSDPTNPACEASGETRLPPPPPTLADPCQGPLDTSTGNSGSATGLWTGGVGFDYLPRLSADGNVVALLATAREIASGEELKAAEASDDLYVVDMRGGLTRVAATRRLTELAGGGSKNEARTGPIVDLGVSPEGSQIALTTVRTTFPLGTPAYVSTPAAAARAVELYDVDLEDDTLTRVTQGYAGQPSEATEALPSFTGSPSFAEGGDLLAFSSNSDNLVYGDGNRNSDAFVVSRVQFASHPTPSEISSAPANPGFAPAWKLGATALTRRDGTVLLEVLVPGAGTVHAGAQSAVRVRFGASGAARPVRRGKRAARRVRTTVATRTVASARARPSAATLVPVTLRLARSYSSLASARGGLSATVSISFAAAGHVTLHETLDVTFARPAPHARRAARRSTRRKRR